MADPAAPAGDPDPPNGARPSDGSNPSRRAAGTRGRQLGLVALLAVAGAGIVAIAAALTWWSAAYQDSLTGPLTITVTGGSAVPELVPLALVALAGFGAALATHGTVRRLVGVVLLLCGGAIAVRSALALTDQPAALVTSLSRPAAPAGSPQLHAVGPVLGIVGGLLLLAAGALIALGRGARQRLGARYDAPTGAAKARPAASAPAAASGAPGETGDGGDWWKALDAGADPTAGEGTDPDSSDSAVKPDR
ncbi:MAG: Trp biosynthesis-associated membrane protein [Nakamurella sp.]